MHNYSGFTLERVVKRAFDRQKLSDTLSFSLNSNFLSTHMQAEDSLGGLLGKSSRLMRNQLHRNLRLVESQITVEQWILLAELWSGDGGLTPLELSKRLLKHKASITNLLKGAEKSGYVYRQKDSRDRRVSKVFLTDKGRQLEAALIPIAMQTIMSATEGISPDHLAITANVLKQIIHNLTANQTQPPPEY